MSELNFEVPLAKTEEFTDFGEFQCSEDVENSNQPPNQSNGKVDNCTFEANDNNLVDNNFAETFSDSLEDLVNTFDDKITKCFKNYDENVEKLAPVQVRSQEDIINECQ